MLSYTLHCKSEFHYSGVAYSLNADLFHLKFFILRVRISYFYVRSYFYGFEIFYARMLDALEIVHLFLLMLMY